tara:strand:+ start:82 stop:1065 length:984 start_codon:yes stop_codon:yes gene_type:complete
MSSHHYNIRADELIKTVRDLSNTISDRREFHSKAKPILKKMADSDFIAVIFERNLRDQAYLTRSWTTYEIPFLYIDETNHFNTKFHVFPPIKSRDSEKAANIIHHHNNYLLTSFTVQGPGYHTMHFEKDIVELDKDEVRLKISKDFFHHKLNFSFVDSYEPHIVFNMEELTTTLVLWSPDQKHLTDGLRNNPIIKPFKKSIIALINALGLNRALGVSEAKVYQWFVQNGKCYRILEEDYFGIYRALKGPEIDLIFTQAVALFVQRSGYNNQSFIKEMLDTRGTPEHWKKWLKYLEVRQKIPEVFGKEYINVPDKKILREDIREACTE